MRKSVVLKVPNFSDIVAIFRSEAFQNELGELYFTFFAANLVEKNAVENNIRRVCPDLSRYLASGKARKKTVDTQTQVAKLLSRYLIAAEFDSSHIDLVKLARQLHAGIVATQIRFESLFHEMINFSVHEYEFGLDIRRVFAPPFVYAVLDCVFHMPVLYALPPVLLKIPSAQLLLLSPGNHDILSADFFELDMAMAAERAAKNGGNGCLVLFLPLMIKILALCGFRGVVGYGTYLSVASGLEFFAQQSEMKIIWWLIGLTAAFFRAPRTVLAGFVTAFLIGYFRRSSPESFEQALDFYTALGVAIATTIYLVNVYEKYCITRSKDNLNNQYCHGFLQLVLTQGFLNCKEHKVSNQKIIVERNPLAVPQVQFAASGSVRANYPRVKQPAANAPDLTTNVVQSPVAEALAQVQFGGVLYEQDRVYAQIYHPVASADATYLIRLRNQKGIFTNQYVLHDSQRLKSICQLRDDQVSRLEMSSQYRAGLFAANRRGESGFVIGNAQNEPQLKFKKVGHGRDGLKGKWPTYKFEQGANEQVSVAVPVGFFKH